MNPKGIAFSFIFMSAMLFLTLWALTYAGFGSMNGEVYYPTFKPWAALATAVGISAVLHLSLVYSPGKAGLQT